MKAILIDVKNRCVQEIDLGPKLEDIFEAIGCEVFAAVYPQSYEYPDTCIYVDDEALIKPFEKLDGAFFIDLFPPQPLFGKALVVGYDYNDGERKECRLSAQDVAEMVQFLDETDTKMYYDHLNNIKPQTFVF